MSAKKIAFIPLVMSVVLLVGCEKKLVTEKSVENSSSGATTQSVQNSDESQFKFLYNPPEEGTAENVGKILFASNDGKTPNADYDLYTINPDGSNKTKLTNFGKFINHPVWSPDRSRIVYCARTDENRDKIFIMTADGREKRQLTFGESDDKFPTWSPDGKQIAYISYRDKVPNLFVMDDRGNNVKQLTFVSKGDTVLWPIWSPKGNVIAYTYNKAGEDIDERLWIIKPDGTDAKELLSSNNKDLSDAEPAWSPDGKIIYFLSNRTKQMEIWKFDYEKWLKVLAEKGSVSNEDIDLKRISNLFAVGIFPEHRPRVSPDGRKIVFYGVGRDWKNIGTNLYTLNVDGSGLTNITKSTDNDEWPDW